MLTNKIIVIVVALFVLGMMSIFTVDQTEKAIKFKFGEIQKVDYEPGLHFQWPYPFNNVKKFDGRIQTLDANPERFLTSDKKNLMVDSFVKWRIGDIKKFYTVVAGDVDQANLRLDPIIKNAFREEFGKRNIKQLVSTDRQLIREILIRNAKPMAANLGLDIIDVRVKRINLPEEVNRSVFTRMEAERKGIAAKLRSQGMEASEKIRADADRQKTVTLANAFRDAEKLRGEGDAKSTEIYANAYGADSEFFSFSRSLNAYKKTFAGNGSMMVLDPDSDFFRYFKNQGASSAAKK